VAYCEEQRTRKSKQITDFRFYETRHANQPSKSPPLRTLNVPNPHKYRSKVDDYESIDSSCSITAL
jgi:hypothetical protein